MALYNKRREDWELVQHFIFNFDIFLTFIMYKNVSEMMQNCFPLEKKLMKK